MNRKSTDSKTLTSICIRFNHSNKYPINSQNTFRYSWIRTTKGPNHSLISATKPEIEYEINFLHGSRHIVYIVAIVNKLSRTE